jgi:uncharacterized protein (TIGR02145 family)
MVRYLHMAFVVLFIFPPLSGQSVSQPVIQQTKRIALVIGNGNYVSSVLANPENDTRAMAENLNYVSGGGCWTYEDNSSAAYTYGRLYNWMTAKLVCPPDWHLPDNEEWLTLINFLGSDTLAGGKIKEKDTSHWKIPNTGATNETGFTALPGGVRSDDGKFYDIWETGRWWSATEESTNNASSMMTFFDKSSAEIRLIFKKMAISVRCIKD